MMNVWMSEYENYEFNSYHIFMNFQKPDIRTISGVFELGTL